MSLRMKLFGAFFTLIIVPLAVLGAALHVLITGLMEDKFAQQTELTLRALAQNVGFLFAEMNKVTDSTIASDAIQDLLDNSSGVDLDAQNFMKLNEVQKKFRELLVNHPSVSNALLYTLDDGRINRIFAKEHFVAMPYGELQEHPLFQEVLAHDGLPYWIGPYEYPELTGAEPVFTQIRVVKDIDTLTNKGILLVQIKPSGLEAVFRYFRFRQDVYATRYVVVSGRGTVLFDSGGRYNGLSIGDYAEGGSFGEVGEAGEAGAGRGPIGFQSDRMRFDGQDSIVSRIGLGLEDWQLVAITSREAVSSEAGQYAGWTAAVVWFCLLLALLFLLLFGNRVTKSIIGTVQFMRRVERGDLTARLPVRGNDETALLARGFNSLVHRITELLDEVKAQQARKTEAEWQALQAQIKPHFLFNTLESINGLAAQNQGRKVSQMVARLGNLLRISIQQKAEITVEQELEHLISYLAIQQYRFEGLFDYDIDIPPALMHCSMLKLTLQPLVENCIQHGFEGIPYMGRIRVSAREEGTGRIAFYVEDNGIGIPADRLAALGWAGVAGKRDLPIGGAGEAGETGGEGWVGAEGRGGEAGRAGETGKVGGAGRIGEANRVGGTGGAGVVGPVPDRGHRAFRAADRGEQRGLGVANVAERLRIRYGPKYGLMLCTDVNAGTVVKMTIPKYEDRSETNETERAVGG